MEAERLLVILVLVLTTDDRYYQSRTRHVGSLSSHHNSNIENEKEKNNPSTETDAPSSSLLGLHSPFSLHQIACRNYWEDNIKIQGCTTQRTGRATVGLVSAGGERINDFTGGRT